MSVHLPLDLVQRLGFAAMEAFKSVPRRGLEIGGLLLGRSEQRDGVTLIYLENFAPVESEHRSGPSFVLSESDLEKLDKLAKRSDAIGMYRTQTRSEDLSLQSEDSALFQRYFEGANHVFLLIQPASRRAALYLATDEGLTLAHELPFHPADFPQPAAPEMREPSPPRPSLQPVSTAPHSPVVAPAGSPPDLPSIPLPRLRRWLVPASACALGLAIGAATIHYRSVPAEPRTSYAGRVGLNVERAGGGLKLQWDRNSAILRNASHAVLYISDGIHKSKMDLGPRELTSGAVSYWPESQDVTFRLEVTSAGGNTTDSIRFMAAGPNPNAPVVQAPVQQAAVPKPEAPPPVPVRPNPAPRTSRPKKPSASAESRSEGSASREEIAESKPSPFRSAPEAQVTPVSSGAAPAPSQPVPREPVRVAAASPTVTPPPVRTTPRANGVTVVAEPVQGSRFGRVLGKIPLLRRLKKQPQAFVPPRVLKEVRPALSATERDSLKRPVPVDVKVYVTESGKVEYAELLNGANHRDLAAAAVYAARRWDFAPAVLGEEKIPGEVVLHFRFEPQP